MRRRALPSPVAVALLLAALAGWPLGSARAQEVMVVAHLDVPAISEATLKNIFLGKITEVNGVPAIPVNLPSGAPARSAFMRLVMDQDDEKYVGYWTVRRYIGKGAPPRELASPREALDYICHTPGAIGYIGGADESPAGGPCKVVLKRP